MKRYFAIVGLILFAVSSQVFSQEKTDPNVQEPGEKAMPEAAALPPSTDGICMIRGVPSAQYTFIKNVKAAKGSYGASSELLPELARMAKAAGADAIVEYSGSQRFGFWPWRLIRPVIYGKAVKWADPSSIDCAALSAKGEVEHQAEMKRRDASRTKGKAKDAAASAETTVAPTPAPEVQSK